MTTPGSFVAGDVLTAADMNLLPAGIVARAVYGSDQGAIVGTETDLTSLSVTFTAKADRYYVLEALVPVISTVSNDEALLRGYFAGSIIVGDTAALSNTATRYLKLVSRPTSTTAGSKTCKLSLQRASGTGTLTAQSGAALNSHIAIYDVGAV